MPLRLEAELALHEAADELAAREVAEVARVVVGDEAARPALGGDLVDALDVALRASAAGEISSRQSAPIRNSRSASSAGRRVSCAE